jgi:hypothetical protein
LAFAAEKTFKPEFGFKFPTYLGGFYRDGRLKELHRLHDQLEREQGVEVYRTKQDLAHEEADEAGEPTDPVNFARGGNGVRLLFDLQWWEALLSDIVRHIDPGSDIPPAAVVFAWRGSSRHASDRGPNPDHQATPSPQTRHSVSPKR